MIATRWRQWLGILLLILLIALIAYFFRRSPSAPQNISVSSALGTDDNTGFQRAYQSRPFQFPTDHGPHPDFRNEWWYATGNLADATGRQFGYQLTLFRIALSPTAPVADSAWRTHQIYMGHFALTDVANQQHYAFERFSRSALGLAGAQATPFRVWLEDWRLFGGETDTFPLHLRAHEQQIEIDLILRAAKPIVLQGNQGLSQKSAEPGNASYYYSYTRLPTQGHIRIDQTLFTVSGASWLDREWSTSALASDQSGWDWFALQLNDGRELMFYRLWRHDGSVDPHSQGVLVAGDGHTRPIRWDELRLQPLGEWRSPNTGDHYPANWRLQLPSEQMELTITPKVADQEMQLTVRYWEGAVSVTGQSKGTAITGQGYLEMTRHETAISR